MNYYLDEDARENCLRHVDDNKQFNVYPKVKDHDFAERLVDEVNSK